MNDNEENARLNRLQAVENTILKQLEFQYHLLNRLKVNYGLAGKGLGYPDAPTDAYGQEALKHTPNPHYYYSQLVMQSIYFSTQYIGVSSN